MQNDLINQHYNFRRNPIKNADDELAVMLLKPGFETEHIKQLEQFLNENDLKIMFEKKHTLSVPEVYALYNDIYRFLDKDLVFGLDWKYRKLDFMTSGPSQVYFIKGQNAFRHCEAFKIYLRNKYNKLSVPSKHLKDEEFEELTIKNLVHVVDYHETEVGIWLFTTKLDGSKTN